MAFKIRTLNKCLRIASTMNPKRYLSLDGRKLVEIIKLLLPESEGQPAAVCVQLVKIGRSYKWDMARMTSAQEEGFLAWLVMEVAKG